jgi:hypothetical protein
MTNFRYEIIKNKIIILVKDTICGTPKELLESSLFKRIATDCIEFLKEKDSYLLDIFQNRNTSLENINILIETLQYLANLDADKVPNILKKAEQFVKDKALLNEFIEYLYDFWRSFDRFVICDSTGSGLDKRPYRTFNTTVESLTDLIRKTYRDIGENITGRHPNIYRQIVAGAEIAAIALPKDIPLPSKKFDKIRKIPVIRQVLLYPPLILNPPMNKRTGSFERTEINPMDKIDINPNDWLCYPAKVGSLIILVYINKKFYELGFSLCNLFEIAEDDDLKKEPDAVYFFGVQGKEAYKFSDSPTVFYDDAVTGMLIASVPDADEFGYFGYLKKMVLTLHNIKMMKSGRLPFHGAFVKIILKGNIEKNVLIIGDTGAGKSESLEAFRMIGKQYIQDLIIIADDMGSIEINKDDNIKAYGTEIGAFLRLDDLQPGYAFGHLDRSIIMSPNKINARIVMPVTTFENVIKGYSIDYLLYANNYEETDEDHPTIERFASAEDALRIFREGTVMSKGTTTSTGIVHSYFANIFGPPQYKNLHEGLALKYFKAVFNKNIYVGQLRTRLGISGWETRGPEMAAKELLSLLSKSVE